jgi:hypothetical protein
LLDALTVQPCGASAAAYEMNAAAVGISICIVELAVDLELPIPGMPTIVASGRPDLIVVEFVVEARCVLSAFTQPASSNGNAISARLRRSDLMLAKPPASP